MFDDSLLDSSPRRAPVLTGNHWIISIVIGAAAFLGGYFGLPLTSPNETSVVLTWSAIVGILITSWALIICYVWADASRNGFNRWVWMFICILLFLVGFIFYLVYSAAKTGDWK